MAGFTNKNDVTDYVTMTMQNPRVKSSKNCRKRVFFILGLLQKAISEWGKRVGAAGEEESTWFLMRQLPSQFMFQKCIGIAPL